MNKKNEINWIYSEHTLNELEDYESKITAVEKRKARKENIRKFLKILSNIILWICAVGGFVLGLLQFFGD